MPMTTKLYEIEEAYKEGEVLLSDRTSLSTSSLFNIKMSVFEVNILKLLPPSCCP